MNTRRKAEGPSFQSISQNDLPEGRKGKHHAIVTQLIDELQRLEGGRALKIPLSELPDSKANIRSALTRSAKQKGLDIATSSDDGFLYLWKPEGKEDCQADVSNAGKAMPIVLKKPNSPRTMQGSYIPGKPSSSKQEAGEQ